MKTGYLSSDLHQSTKWSTLCRRTNHFLEKTYPEYPRSMVKHFSPGACEEFKRIHRPWSFSLLHAVLLVSQCVLHFHSTCNFGALRLHVWHSRTATLVHHPGKCTDLTQQDLLSLLLRKKSASRNAQARPCKAWWFLSWKVSAKL